MGREACRESTADVWAGQSGSEGTLRNHGGDHGIHLFRLADGSDTESRREEEISTDFCVSELEELTR